MEDYSRRLVHRLVSDSIVIPRLPTHRGSRLFRACVAIAASGAAGVQGTVRGSQTVEAAQTHILRDMEPSS